MLLTWLIFLPLVFSLIVVFMPNDRMARTITLAGALFSFALSLVMLWRFDGSTHQLQLVEKHAWLPAFGISYFLGVDGISLWLVLLTTLLTPIIVLGSWTGITEKVKSFHAALLVLETAMLGTFLSMDAILFYMFWEAMLVPMYLIVGIWGGPRRIYAALKLFIFTMAGSVFMLLAIIALMYYTKEQQGAVSASILDFYRLRIPFISSTFFTPQTLMFFAFALAFAIKVPMFPLHTWLPDAHVEAPTAGSVILAGVLLKMGTYGFMRFAIPIFPEAVEQYAPLFIGLAVFGIIYGALVAMVQEDIKKLVAYSSVSHLGYVMLGLFALNIEGFTGGLYQMLNHGVSTGALFLLVGMIYERTHSRKISQYGGLAKVLPIFTIGFFIVTLSSIAVPGTNGFVGEFLILLGAFKASKLSAVFAVTGVVFGAVYMLWMFKRVFYGPAGELVPDVAAWGGAPHEPGHGHGHRDDNGQEDDHGHGRDLAQSDDHRHGSSHAAILAHDSGHTGSHKSHAAARSESRGSSHSQNIHLPHPLLDLTLREKLVLAPLIVLIFWMGLFSNQFLNKSKAALEFFAKNRAHYHLTVVGQAEAEAAASVAKQGTQK